MAIEAAANDNATAKEQAIARAVAAEAEAAKVKREHAEVIAAAQQLGGEQAANAARARAEADAAAASLTSLQGSGAEKDQRLAAAEAAVVAAQASQAAAEQQAADSRAEAEAAKKNAAASKDEETRVRAKITDAYAKLTEAGRREAAAAAVMADANRKVESAGNSEVEARAATAAAAAATEAARVAILEANAVKEEAATGLIEEAARISSEAELAVTAAQKKRDEALTAKNAAEQQAAAFKEAAVKALAEKEAALAAAKEAQAKSAIFEAQLLDTAAQIDVSIEAQTGLQGANAELQKQLEECRNKLRECLESSTKNKADIAAIIAALGSDTVFDPEVKDEDGVKLKEAITKLLQYVDTETTSNAVIVKLATLIQSGDEITPDALGVSKEVNPSIWAIIDHIQTLKAMKQPTEEQKYETPSLCFLVFFVANLLSTHFGVHDGAPLMNSREDNSKMIQDVMFTSINTHMAQVDQLQKVATLKKIIDRLSSILNLMQQIQQTGIYGKYTITDATDLDILDFLDTELTNAMFVSQTFEAVGRTREDFLEKVNKLFSLRTGYSIAVMNPLTNIFYKRAIPIGSVKQTTFDLIYIDSKKLFKDVGNVAIVLNGKTPKPIAISLRESESYETLSKKLVGTKELSTTDLKGLYSVTKDKTENLTFKTFSYPVLFYQYLVIFKLYLNSKEGFIGRTKCRLPKIFKV